VLCAQLKMWNSEYSVIPVKSTATLTYNNLSTAGSLISYVHKTAAFVSTESESSPNPMRVQSKDNAYVQQSAFVKLRDRTCLAVVTTGSVQVWEVMRAVPDLVYYFEGPKDIPTADGMRRLRNS